MHLGLKLQDMTWKLLFPNRRTVYRLVSVLHGSVINISFSADCLICELSQISKRDDFTPMCGQTRSVKFPMV